MSNHNNHQRKNLNPACICLCGLYFESPRAECHGDHLKNWKLWLERRKKMHRLLSKKLDRLPGDLLMNASEEHRSVREEKLVLEYRKIETHFDKYRGNPEFWKLPLSLKSLSPPCKGSPYYVVSTKEEKNQIPSIEYVGIPHEILDEKHILPRSRKLHKLWHESSYRKQVIQEVSQKLLEIEPHKPDLAHLMIKGSRIEVIHPKNLEKQRLKSSSQLSSRISASLKSDISMDSLKSKESIVVPKRSLKVNGREFGELSNFAFAENKLTVLFEYFVGCPVPCEQAIVFENTGQVVLRLYWLQYKKLKIFRKYTEKTEIFHPFKFNRKEIILLPGHKMSFPFWFGVTHPGNYFEEWEITSRPRAWKMEYRLIIVLKGFAMIENLTKRMQEISENLNTKIRATAIKDLMNDIIKKGTYCAPTVSNTFVFSERELFESENLTTYFGTTSPKYIYDASVISKLKNFYKSTRFPEDPPEWNLSLKKLNETARKRDLISYFDDRLEFYKRALMKREILQENIRETRIKPATKRENLGTKKNQQSKKDTLQAEESIKIPSYYSQLNEMLRKLEKPSIYVNLERKKYLFCYTILKTFLWKMFDQLDNLDSSPFHKSNSSDFKRKNSNHKLQIADRLLYEIFNESYILRTKRIATEFGSSHARPKIRMLEGVDCSETRRVFKIYFGKDEAAEKRKKKESTVKKQPKKAAQKEETLNLEDLIPDFNPGLDTQNEITESTTQTFNKHSTTTGEIDEKTYLTVYVSLCNAIDALVDTIEAFNEVNIPSSTLHVLDKCHVLCRKAPASEPAPEIPSKATIPSKTSSFIIGKRIDSHLCSDYYEFLKQLHWQDNLDTQKYFIDEERISTTAKRTISQNDAESEVGKVLSNLFSLTDFQRVPLPYGLEETAVQTEVECEVDSGDDDKGTLTSLKTKNSIESEDSRNIFYFLEMNGTEKTADD